MPNALATLDDLKAALDFSGSAEDTLLTSLLEAATASAARLIGLPSILREESIIEYPRADFYGCQRIRLDRYPVEAVTTLKLAMGTSDSDYFSTLTSLVQDTDFEVAQQFGCVELFYGETWSPDARANLVVYTAGWANPSDEDLPDTAIAVPADLRRAIVIEATRLYNTRLDAGITKVGAGSKASGHSPDQSDVHEALRSACSIYRRVSL